MTEKPTAERLTPESRAEVFNDLHPVGTPVIYYPGTRDAGRGRISTTRSTAWVLCGHTAVVMVDGYAGGIALDHVDVLTATRSDDQVLQQLATCLAPDVGQRLLELVHADSRAQQLLDHEHRTQRAEDLAEECRRQLQSLRRQNDRLTTQVAELEPAVDRVRRLHSQDTSVLAAGEWCPGCGHEEPCPTTRALNGQTTPADQKGTR